MEDHGNVAIFGIHPIDDAIADFDVAFAGFLQASHHAQAGTFPTAGGADQHQEFFVLDIQGDIVDHFDFAEAFVDVIKLDTCHYSNSFSLWLTGIHLIPATSKNNRAVAWCTHCN